MTNITFLQIFVQIQTIFQQDFLDSHLITINCFLYWVLQFLNRIMSQFFKVPLSQSLRAIICNVRYICVNVFTSVLVFMNLNNYSIRELLITILAIIIKSIFPYRIIYFMSSAPHLTFSGYPTLPSLVLTQFSKRVDLSAKQRGTKDQRNTNHNFQVILTLFCLRTAGKTTKNSRDNFERFLACLLLFAFIY